jgi:flavin-binding protein dodecin
MNKKVINFTVVIKSIFAVSLIFLPLCLHAQTAPNWVNNLHQAFPEREWVAVTAQGTDQPQAEAAAMNALARAFRTDVASITLASQQFSQIVNNSAGSRNVSFDESRNFAQEVITGTNVKGLIGVQIDVYRARDTVYVNARMNRRECSARYSAMIRENAAVINRLLALAAAASPGTFEAYANISFAYAIAQVTDNFQNILEVLDPSAVNRRPGYGGANAIRAAMFECAALITVGLAIETEQQADRTLFTRAAGSFFRDRGFRVSEQGSLPNGSAGNYVLRANVSFEELRQSVISCRYYFDAALENRNGVSIFSFTENDRKAHMNIASEARRLAVRAVETSIKEGRFAQEFDAWLNSLLY